jgi:hypothetical protein
MALFQNNPGSTGVTGLNFARTSGNYGTYKVDDVEMLVPGSGFISWMTSMGYDPGLGFEALAQLNPAGDGIPALLKYVFALPMEQVSNYSKSVLVDPGTNTLTLVMIHTDPYLSVAIRTTEDLMTWATQASSIELPGVSQDGIPPGLVRRQYQLPTPAGDTLFVQTEVQVM